MRDLLSLFSLLLHVRVAEDRPLSQVDFDYAFDEFKPINVKLLGDDPKKTQRTITRWSDIGGMEMTKQELIQTVQWRFEVCVCSSLFSLTSSLSHLACQLFLACTHSIGLRCSSLWSIGMWKNAACSNIGQRMPSELHSSQSK